MAATDGPHSNVIQLHIYDLTRGLAAELSPSLIGALSEPQVYPYVVSTGLILICCLAVAGKQIDGIW